MALGGEVKAVRGVRSSNWRSYRIPTRLIEEVYGRGNFDDAGEDIVDALREVSEFADQYSYRFEFDSTHVNPWYHFMVFAIDGIPDLVHGQFIARLAELGIAPDGA